MNFSCSHLVVHLSFKKLFRNFNSRPIYWKNVQLTTAIFEKLSLRSRETFNTPLHDFTIRKKEQKNKKQKKLKKGQNHFIPFFFFYHKIVALDDECVKSNSNQPKINYNRGIYFQRARTFLKQCAARGDWSILKVVHEMKRYKINSIVFPFNSNETTAFFS